MRYRFTIFKYRSRLQDANQECSRTKKKLEESIAERRALEEQNTKKDKRIHELSSRLKHSDESAKKQVDQVMRHLHRFMFQANTFSPRLITEGKSHFPRILCDHMKRGLITESFQGRFCLESVSNVSDL